MQPIIELIKKYNQILLYRHVNPDDDAFGSQAGMYHYLKTYFPEKSIVLMGVFTSDLVSRYFPELPECILKEEPSLAIVMDTARKDRIDGDLKYADYIVKIDHHIITDQYGDLNIVDESSIACAQIITHMMNEVSELYPLTKDAAAPLYMGIIGDSNRFMYQNTSAKTFSAASLLVATGINIDSLYRQMYLKSEKSLEIKRFILNNYVNDEGVGYYVMKDEDLKALGVSREIASGYVTELADIDEIKIWIAITENKEGNNVRVSLRSRDYPVNEVAAKFNGGGHRLAAGATLDHLNDIPKLIAAAKAIL
ncbi:MAG: bifunctional oligoribonuclease/PAP phosphatase NrnA [Erysipelotrichaceae bacterium]|nr:bifunctional oligoribonuclease/PAP phosphatase NrnA [Erysipelotrichaceae bacterium]